MRRWFLYLSLLVSLGVANVHAAAIAVQVKDGTLQAGTTTGFNVSSGTVQTLFFSTATVQRAVKWRDDYTQSYKIVLNVKDPPYNASASLSDNAAAFQAAINALPAGGKLFIPPGEYIVRSQLDLTSAANRITIEGESGVESVIKFLPSASPLRLFLISGNQDNVTFRNFGVTNSSDAANMKAFVVSGSGGTQFTWDHIFFTNWTRNAIDATASVYYTIIKNCRFLNTADDTSTFLAKAIDIAGNDIVIENNRFSGNDVGIVAVGAKIGILRNAFESEGSSGNSLITYNSYVSGWNIDIANNYIEANDPNGGAWLQLDDTYNAVFRDNYVVGELGSVEITDSFLLFSGTNTRFPTVTRNVFRDPKTYFIDAEVPVKLTRNYYTFNAVEMSSYSGIVSYMSGPSYMEIDVPTVLTWNPNSISSGTAEVSSAFTVLGSSVGDHVEVFPPYSLQGMMATGYVENSTGTVRVVLYNSTTGSVNLASGDWGVRVQRWFK